MGFPLMNLHHDVCVFLAPMGGGCDFSRGVRSGDGHEQRFLAAIWPPPGKAGGGAADGHAMAGPLRVKVFALFNSGKSWVRGRISEVVVLARQLWEGRAG